MAFDLPPAVFTSSPSLLAETGVVWPVVVLLHSLEPAGVQSFLSKAGYVWLVQQNVFIHSVNEFSRGWRDAFIGLSERWSIVLWFSLHILRQIHIHNKLHSSYFVSIQTNSVPQRETRDVAAWVLKQSIGFSHIAFLPVLLLLQTCTCDSPFLSSCVSRAYGKWCAITWSDPHDIGKAPVPRLDF